MADAFLVPADQPPNVLLTAIAKAAAEIAAQEAGRRQGAALGREAVEEIVEDAIGQAFLRVGVDLKDHKSVAAFNAAIHHAERSRGLWERAGATAFGAVATAIIGGIITAVVRFVSFGGGTK